MKNYRKAALIGGLFYCLLFLGGWIGYPIQVFLLLSILQVMIFDGIFLCIFM